MKKLDVIIRLAKISDTEILYHILSESFKPFKKYYTKEAFNATVISTDEITKRINNPEIYVLVILVNNRIVGTVSVYQKNNNCLYIYTMSVYPHYQKKELVTNYLNM